MTRGAREEVRAFTIDAGERSGRLAELVREQASDFVDAVEDEFGFLEDPGDALEDGLDAVNDIADDSGESGLDAVKDVAGEAKDEIEDLF
jgi:hypothetical protein